MGLGDPAPQSSSQIIDMVREIMDRELRQQTKGITQDNAIKLARELRQARSAVTQADPDLVRLELEQVRKQARKTLANH